MSSDFVFCVIGGLFLLIGIMLGRANISLLKEIRKMTHTKTTGLKTLCITGLLCAAVIIFNGSWLIYSHL